jgi:hypothetical protein
MQANVRADVWATYEAEKYWISNEVLNPVKMNTNCILLIH